MRNYLCKNKTYKRRTKKRYLAIIGFVFIATSLIVLISSALATPSLQTINVTGLKTQFDLNIAYSYVGPGPRNASYTADNGAIMWPTSLDPSLIVFNITRMPGTQFPSCDAVIEFYEIQITTDTGLTEKACYFIGTNYKSSFSATELSALFAKVNDLASPRQYYVVVGDFPINMTDNTSIVSTPVGSYGCYSTGYSTPGLWTAGKPNAISVSVQRIGYITISDGSVSIYKDASTSNVKAMAQLSNYKDGFLHNRLVPATKLPQIDLFHPTS